MAVAARAASLGRGFVQGLEFVIKYMPTSKVEEFYRIFTRREEPKPGKELPVIKADVGVPTSVAPTPTPVAVSEESRRLLAVALAVRFSWQESHAAPPRPFPVPALGVLEALTPATAAVTRVAAAGTSAAPCAAAAAAALGPLPAGLLGQTGLFVPLPPPHRDNAQSLPQIGFLIAIGLALYPLPPPSLI